MVWKPDEPQEEEGVAEDAVVVDEGPRLSVLGLPIDGVGSRWDEEIATPPSTAIDSAPTVASMVEQYDAQSQDGLSVLGLPSLTPDEIAWRRGEDAAPPPQTAFASVDSPTPPSSYHPASASATPFSDDVWGATPPQGYAQSSQTHFGYVQPNEGMRELAGWWRRVAAYLVDVIISSALYFVLVITLLLTGGSDSGVASFLLLLIGVGSSIGLSIYNVIIQQGRTGQSWGKRILGVELLDDYSATPIGPMKCFVRQLAHMVDGMAFYIGFFWPLVDSKRQTFADKICSTVVVKV